MRLQERAQSAPTELSDRFAQPPEGAQPDQVQPWELRSLPASSRLLEYVPGRDTLISAPQLAAGLDAFDARSGEHVLRAATLPSKALDAARQFVLRCAFPL